MFENQESSVSQEEHGFTIQDLEIQKIALEGRIKKIEQDLREPLSVDSSEQAVQTSQFIFMKQLLEVEKSNLVKVMYEIAKKNILRD
jgi:hypothetical protein